MRPNIIKRQHNSLAQSGKYASVPTPNKAAVEPVLVRQPAASPIACIISIPVSDNNRENITKIAIYKNKNVNMRPKILAGTKRPSTFTAITMCGCKVLLSSAQAMRHKTKIRITLSPPAADPMQPPINTNINNK